MTLGSMTFNFPGFSYGFEFSDEKPLFILSVQSLECKEEPIEIASKNLVIVDRVVQDNNIKIVFKGDVFKGAGSLEVHVSLRHEDKEIIGTLEVYTKGQICVREVQFPTIVWDKIEPSDHLLMPSCFGDNIANPTKEILEEPRWLGEYNCIYPSRAAMQYMVLHNKDRCVYISAYSISDDTFALKAKVLSRNVVRLSINHYPFLREGRWLSPKCGFGLLQGDWHSGADLYRSHMGNKFKTPKVPTWIRDGFHGWVWFWMKRVGDKSWGTFKDLPSFFRRIKNVGLNTINIPGWSGYGFDTDYPDYNINPEVGTEEELRNAINEIRTMGGHVLLYTNGRLIDPKSDFYKQNSGDKAICLREDGTPYTESYETGVDFRIACPSCKSYQNQLVDEIERIFRDYRVHGVQIDQVGCGSAYLCFAQGHPHYTPSSNWMPGLSNMLQRIRKVHKAIDPDLIVWSVGCQERLGQYYDINEGAGEVIAWGRTDTLPEQAKYTYPERIVTGECQDIKSLCHTYVQGKPFGVSHECLDKPDFVELLRTFIAIRKTEASYFCHGIFRDNVGLEITGQLRAYARALMEIFKQLFLI
jgi:hypothetical protein